MVNLVIRKKNPDRDFFGFKMRTRLRYYDEKILNEELDPQKNIYAIPDNPKMVVDIGAHIGGTALRCAKMGAKVRAFEPEADNFDTLVYNVALNKMEDRIVCKFAGVGSPGIKELYLHPRMSGTNSIYLNQSGLHEKEYQMALFLSIGQVLKDIEYCDLLKLDCEGSEEDIIRDFNDQLAAKVSQISVEFHDKHKVKELIDILSKWYKPENIHRYEWVFTKK